MANEDRFMEAVRVYPAKLKALTCELTLTADTPAQLSAAVVNQTAVALSTFQQYLVHHLVIRNTAPGATQQVHLEGISGRICTPIYPGQSLDVPVRVDMDETYLILAGAGTQVAQDRQGHGTTVRHPKRRRQSRRSRDGHHRPRGARTGHGGARLGPGEARRHQHRARRQRHATVHHRRGRVGPVARVNYR